MFKNHFVYILRSSSYFQLIKRDRYNNNNNRGKGQTAQARQIQTEIARELQQLSRDVAVAMGELNEVGEAYQAVTKEMPVAKVRRRARWCYHAEH